jgi:ferredoxin-nitrite reductase
MSIFSLQRDFLTNLYVRLCVAFYSPNSCGQVQAADIGIMGAPARKLDPETGKNKAVPGCKIFVGGRIGEDAHLSLEPFVQGIALEDGELLPVLVDILKTQFGAVDKK